MRILLVVTIVVAALTDGVLIAALSKQSEIIDALRSCNDTNDKMWERYTDCWVELKHCKYGESE